MNRAARSQGHGLVATMPAMATEEPAIITGCWQLSAGHHGPIDEEETLSALAHHSRLGMSTLDCGDIYTGVEARIGRFLGSYCPPALRAQVHVNTKFVPDLDSLELVDAGYVEATLRRSIRRLQINGPLDLVQFHWWEYGAGDFVKVAKLLASMTSATVERPRLVRRMGITNFDTASTAAMLQAGIPLATAQVQLSLFGAFGPQCRLHVVGKALCPVLIHTLAWRQTAGL
jgi:aryl-alcohol dehydrogenase-like predicted oxidoreductase